MTKRILILDGHPDPAGGHFCNALGVAYDSGARDSGHATDMIRIADLDFPLLRTQEEFETGTPVPAIAKAQDQIRDADHFVIIYPLWLGTMPAIVKAFFEQAFRPGFAFRYRDNGMAEKILKGRSAHIVVTMGMPGWIYRWLYQAHSLKSFERNILRFVGIGPIRETVIGGVGTIDATKRERWIARLRDDGSRAR